MQNTTDRDMVSIQQGRFNGDEVFSSIIFTIYTILKNRSYDMLVRRFCEVGHREGKGLNLDFQKLANLPEWKLWINWLPPVKLIGKAKDYFRDVSDYLRSRTITSKNL
jgi:hypothetical protein